jgi:uncharacterized short protein YbdD (DUF466 family)
VEHLDEISVEELQDALDRVDEKKPIQRLLEAIAYKNGITQTELVVWYDVQLRTIYSWLMRLDTDESLEQAFYNDKKLAGIRKYQKYSKNLKTLSRNHPKKPGSTRRR